MSNTKWQMPFFRDDYRDAMQERALPSPELEERLEQLAEREYGAWENAAQPDQDGRSR